MDRLIEVKVNGNHLYKDNNLGGVQGEGNVTALRIEFDPGWDNFAKTITFWDARGENPVKRILTADLLEDIVHSTRVYLVLIPPEPLVESGWMSFVIDGYIDDKRQRTVEDKLKVKPASSAEDAGEPSDPTPSQAEQLQMQMENLLGDIREETGKAEAAAERAEDALGKGPYIDKETSNWWVWDDQLGEYVDTGYYSGGASPYIGSNGNWFVGDTDTGVAARGPAGPAGADGKDGSDGAPGKDGYTPVKGKDYFDGAPGKDGAAGADGADGYSPTVSVTPITGGHRVTITDKNGAKSFDVMDGEDGQDAEGGGTVDIESVEAEKVVFTRDMYSAYAIGNIELDNGRGKYASAGDSLVDALDAIFDKETPPEVTQPSLSVTFGGVKAYEVGTTASVSYSATFNPGSYSFGPDTGVTVTEWSATDGETTKTTASGSFSRLMEDGTSFTMKVNADHGAGAVPLTNKGNAYAAGKIAAGTVSKTSGTISAYRNTFYGTKTTKDAVTSAVIRGLTKSNKALANGSTFTVDIPVGAMRVIIAYPATLRDLTAVKDQNDSNSNIVSSFVKTTIPVPGENSYEAISYKVYTLDFASAYDTANKYSVTI